MMQDLAIKLSYISLCIIIFTDITDFYFESNR
jgi:hypothetical protein